MKPVISIITICYNAERLLEGTILSVIEQSYKNIEYIIVDGSSRDSTVTLIKKHEKNISKWISEPDEGIYDAMNKGLKMATGDYVWFMNAGDRIFKKDTIKNMVKNWSPEIDAVYGEAMIVNDRRDYIGKRSEITTRPLPNKIDWKQFTKGMLICHQSFLVKRSIVPFYIKNNISADFDWMIKCLKISKNTLNTNQVLCEYLAGGISVQGKRKSLKDRFKIMIHHFGWLTTLVAHINIFFRALYFKINNCGKPQYD